MENDEYVKVLISAIAETTKRLDDIKDPLERKIIPIVDLSVLCMSSLEIIKRMCKNSDISKQLDHEIRKHFDRLLLVSTQPKQNE